MTDIGAHGNAAYPETGDSVTRDDYCFITSHSYRCGSSFDVFSHVFPIKLDICLDYFLCSYMAAGSNDGRKFGDEMCCYDTVMGGHGECFMKIFLLCFS